MLHAQAFPPHEEMNSTRHAPKETGAEEIEGETTSNLLRGRGLRILDEDIVRVEQERETAERPLIGRPPTLKKR